MRSFLSSGWVLGGIAYCIAVVALDWVSSIGLYRGIGVTPWSPATGLAVAFSFVFGRHSWIYVGVAEALSLVVSGPSLFGIFAIAVISVATAAVWLACGSALRSLDDFDPRLRTVSSLLHLLFVGLCGAILHA